MPRKAILEGGKRDEIIAVATKLFFTEGFEATSVRKILALVDGEIGMFYHEWIKMIGGPVPGIYELLCEYKAAGHRLFGLSNWSTETFPLVRDAFPSLKLLEGMVVSGYEGVTKPRPEIYRLLLDRYSLRASDCVFIDDNPANAAGAAAVGIRGIRFTSCDALRAAL